MLYCRTNVTHFVYFTSMFLFLKKLLGYWGIANHCPLFSALKYRARSNMGGENTGSKTYSFTSALYDTGIMNFAQVEKAVFYKNTTYAM